MDLLIEISQVNLHGKELIFHLGDPLSRIGYLK